MQKMFGIRNKVVRESIIKMQKEKMTRKYERNVRKTRRKYNKTNRENDEKKY